MNKKTLRFSILKRIEFAKKDLADPMLMCFRERTLNHIKYLENLLKTCQPEG